MTDLDPRARYFAKLRREGVSRLALANKAGLKRQRIYDLTQPGITLDEASLKRLTDARRQLVKGSTDEEFNEAIFAQRTDNLVDLLNNIRTRFKRALSEPNTKAENYFNVSIERFHRRYQKGDVYVLFTYDAVPAELTSDVPRDIVVGALERGATYVYVTAKSQPRERERHRISTAIEDLQEMADRLNLKEGGGIYHLVADTSPFLTPGLKYAVFRGPSIGSGERASVGLPIDDGIYIHAPLSYHVAVALFGEVQQLIQRKMSAFDAQLKKYPKDGKLAADRDNWGRLRERWK